MTILGVLASALLLAAGVQSKVIFSENFEKNVFQSGSWIKSMKERYVNQPVMVKVPLNAVDGYKSDSGVELTQEMKYYGFGVEFGNPISLTSDELVIQYEVKLEALTCGGAYIKLLRDGSRISELDNDTPYSIMFGPDRCGSDSKVHFIMQHQNPITGAWEEKHFNNPPTAKTDKKTHLYTLVVRADNSFEIMIDRDVVSSGDLLTSMRPPINPPETIDDPTDSKPADWVDEAEIPDPTAVKPDDWDESQPRMIPDETAVKPDGWLDDAQEVIPDPAAVKPDDWDDEEDGEWEAPMIANPVCEAVGCGIWTPPMIKNPLYKGKWSAPMIPNPDFKGVWSPRQIPNPAYFRDETPAKSIAPIGALAVEVWTTNAGINFDNFLITDSKDEAMKLAAETFSVKSTAEQLAEEAEHKEARERSRAAKLEEGGVRNVIEVYVAYLFDYIAENTHLALGGAAAIIIAIIFLIVQASRESRPAPTSEVAEETNTEEVVEPAETTEEKEEVKEETTVKSRRGRSRKEES